MRAGSRDGVLVTAPKIKLHAIAVVRLEIDPRSRRSGEEIGRKGELLVATCVAGPNVEVVRTGSVETPVSVPVSP